MEEKENQRREKIKRSLRQYYSTSKGIDQRKRLSAAQSKRMAFYSQFLYENNYSKNKTNDEV